MRFRNYDSNFIYMKCTEILSACKQLFLTVIYQRKMNIIQFQNTNNMKQFYEVQAAEQRGTESRTVPLKSGHQATFGIQQATSSIPSSIHNVADDNSQAGRSQEMVTCGAQDMGQALLQGSRSRALDNQLVIVKPSTISFPKTINSDEIACEVYSDEDANLSSDGSDDTQAHKPARLLHVNGLISSQAESSIDEINGFLSEVSSILQNPAVAPKLHQRRMSNDFNQVHYLSSQNLAPLLRQYQNEAQLKQDQQSSSSLMRSILNPRQRYQQSPDFILRLPKQTQQKVQEQYSNQNNLDIRAAFEQFTARQQDSAAIKSQHRMAGPPQVGPLLQSTNHPQKPANFNRLDPQSTPSYNRRRISQVGFHKRPQSTLCHQSQPKAVHT